ncbi:MAG: mandelate racemase/muconate lactonizing enzyme family protein [Myxococcota bacterium]
MSGGATAELFELRLPLLAPLATAHGAIAERRGFALALRGDDGVCGAAEALPLPAFGGESLAACRAALGAALAGLAARAAHPADAMRPARGADGVARRAADGARVAPPLGTAPVSSPLDAALERALADAPVARAACETALLDLAARRAGAPLAARLGAVAPRLPARIPVNALVGDGAPEEAARAARAAVDAGFRAVKCKVGAAPLARDVERVRAVRDAVGSAVAVRLDANGAWDERGAGAALAALAPFAIEWVEQPIPPGDVDALARVRAASPVAIAADESLVDAREAARVVECAAVDAVVLKLPPLGGPLRALALARAARARGMAVCVTSFLDGSLGVRAAAHAALACAEDGALSACGLATSDRLAADSCAPLRVENGALVVDGDEPGLGAPLRAGALGAPIAAERAG